MITLKNYEQYLFQYAEGTLDEQQTLMVVHFLEEHPGIKEEFEIYLDAPQVPRLEVVMPDKSKLQRKPLPRIVWIRIAAAACIAALVMVPVIIALHQDTHRPTYADNHLTEKKPLPVAGISHNSKQDHKADETIKPDSKAMQTDVHESSPATDTCTQHLSETDRKEPREIRIHQENERIEKMNIIMDGSMLDESTEVHVIHVDNLIAYHEEPTDTLECTQLIAYALPNAEQIIKEAASKYHKQLIKNKMAIEEELLALADKIQIGTNHKKTIL